MKAFIYTIIAIVSATILAGFFVVGSPADQRARRFDDQRVSDLGYIQNEIIYYWQSKQKLPGLLSDLNDATRGVRVPTDPDSGESYAYAPKAGTTDFSLCAVFAKNSKEEGTSISRPMYGETSWDHGEGKVCFDRHIDPDIYKPFNSGSPKGVPAKLIL